MSAPGQASSSKPGSAGSGGANQRKGGKVAPATAGYAKAGDGAKKLPGKTPPTSEAAEAESDLDVGRIAKWMAMGSVVWGLVGALMGGVLGVGVAFTDYKAIAQAYVRIAALAAGGTPIQEGALPPAPWDEDAIWRQSLNRLLPLMAGFGALSGALLGAVGGWSTCVAQTRVIEAEVS